VILATLLLGLGLAFIVAEVFFPSFGVLSICATVAIVAAVVVAFREGTQSGVNFLIATAVLVPAAILLGLKLFPKSPIGKHMVAPGLSFESQAASDPRDLMLVGAEGLLETDCRPAGVARLSSRRVDVVSRGEPIERGARVRVLEVKGNRVVVTRSEDPQGEASA
jgi:membrane-bound serine protease (ClpP class)